MTATPERRAFDEPIRAYGDISESRAKFRRLIRKGQAILDEIEGQRLVYDPEADAYLESLFRDTASYNALRRVSFWHRSIESLFRACLPTHKGNPFDRPLPDTEPGMTTATLIDNVEAYVQATIDDLEAIAEVITDEDPE